MERIMPFGVSIGLFVVLVSFWGLVSACNARETAATVTNHASSPTAVSATPIRKQSGRSDDSDSVCFGLEKLKNIPYSAELESEDPVYNRLVSKKNEAIPCLVEMIADETIMNDPRTAPHVNDFRVGDAAVFMLLMLTGKNWEPDTMFTPRYAEMWKTEGVYAYFSFVESTENRQKIQAWWRDWLSNQYKKKAVKEFP